MKQYFGGKYYKVENTKHKSLCSINLFSYLDWYWAREEKDTIKCSQLVGPLFNVSLISDNVTKMVESLGKKWFNNLGHPASIYSDLDPKSYCSTGSSGPVAD